MVVNRSVLFLVVACVCFAIALLTAVSAISTNESAFVDGGLLAFALSFLP